MAIQVNPPLGAKLQCIECNADYDLSEVVFRCRNCDGLLSVEHDLDAIQSVPGEDWKALFSERMSSFEHPWSSGVWAKKEWVHPSIRQEQIVNLGEGRSPLVPLPRLAQEMELGKIWIKQCGISHTGSFKDLGMTVLVSHVRWLLDQGRKIRAVACASSGDTSAALAAYASAAGIPTVVFLPAGKISMAQLVQPIASGSIVLSLDTDFDGCMQLVKEITADPTIYLANSMNPLRIEGQKTVSLEIVQQLNWQVPDWIIIPGGNLGNVSALGQGLRLLRKTGIIDRYPRICVAQAAQANPLYLSFKNGLEELRPVTAKTTLASAIQIGNPVSYPRARRALLEFDGVVEQATEEELANAAARVDLHGMFCDPHTGVALASLFKLRETGVIKAGETAVVVSTAHGLKFADSKTRYHQGDLPFEARYRNTPLELPADVESVRRALDERL